MELLTKEKINTVHTSRTLMFSELSRVMDHGFDSNSFEQSLGENVTGKLTKSNIEKTNRYLKQLYGFNEGDSYFKGFKYFWKISSNESKPLLALLYAIHSDNLIAESINVVINKSIGHKVTVDAIEENISQFHPGRYSVITSRSIAKNIASSWKQAGFILGKVKNLRAQPEVDYLIVASALFLGYLDNLRGEYLLSSKYIRALGIQESIVRELTFEASKRDLLTYQFSGSVTTMKFNNLFKQLEINGE
jgi:hypothetical protein